MVAVAPGSLRAVAAPKAMREPSQLEATPHCSRNLTIRRGRCWNNGRVTDPVPAAGASTLDPAIAALLKRDHAGLITAVIQEDATGEVLMVGWMDDLALHKTLTTGRSTFFSRSRGEYWVKGETSGHRQWVREVRLDCDGDTVLVKVHQDGPACHTGDRSCFDGRRLPALVTQRSEEAGR
jgi:phosphoribosyl-AMP cyclohydrolase